MDIIKTVREIGLFETSRNMASVSDSQQVCSKVEAFMPMPGADFAPRIEAAVDYLLQFGKRKLLLLSPEIALLEAIAARKIPNVQVILAIPSDMNAESKERLLNNIPGNVSVQILEEPYFPEAFTPADGIIASFGYLAGDRLMALPECYRMTDHYGGFWGKKVFLPYVARMDSTRFPQWMELNPGKFNDVWR